MTEVDLMRQIQVAASRAGHRLFRNNTAQGWVGKFASMDTDGTVTLRVARVLHAGLCVGSSDLIGWTRLGRFLAIEVKMPGGHRTAEQKQFIAAVVAAGGLAGFAESVDQAMEIIDGH